MSFYRRHILPRITHLVCGLPTIRRQRERLIPRAAGAVLEVGIGSGLNLPYYDGAKVTRLWGLDPSEEMLRLAEGPAGRTPFDVSLLRFSGEDIPLAGGSVDTIVMTYTLCSIPDPGKAFGHMVRVLKPGGRLLFCEHGAAPDPGVRSWQNRLAPLWKRVAGGCHLNREIPGLITRGGLRIEELESGYVSGLRFVSYTYLGVAGV